MGGMEMVGSLGSRKLQRIVDLIAKHGIFGTSRQCMHGEGNEGWRSMCRDNWVGNRLSKSATSKHVPETPLSPSLTYRT